MTNIVRCVVMGAETIDSTDAVRDAVVSTIKNIQSFNEDKVKVQFIFPCNYTREGWKPLAGAVDMVSSLTNSWVDQWFDQGIEFAPIIHPILTLVDDQAARGIAESELSPRRMDKHELDAMFRLETSFGVRTYSAYSEWVRTVFNPDRWDMFNNMALEGNGSYIAPTYVMTIHDDTIDERSLRLEFEANRSDVQVYSFMSHIGRDGKRVTRPRINQ